jgi:hypothetical protein
MRESMWLARVTRDNVIARTPNAALRGCLNHYAKAARLPLLIRT